MKNSIIFEILNDMVEELTVSQLKKLQEVLLKRFDEEEKQPDPANNEEYLEMLYRTILGRESEATGMKYWLDQLNYTISREKALNGFMNSTENLEIL